MAKDISEMDVVNKDEQRQTRAGEARVDGRWGAAINDDERCEVNNNISSTIQNIEDFLELCKPSNAVVSSGAVPDLQVPSILIIGGDDDDNQHPLKFPLVDDESIQRIKTGGSYAKIGINGKRGFDSKKRLTHEVLPVCDGGNLKLEGLTEQVAFQDLLHRIQSDLKIPGKVGAVLYKLLYYESGCFFQKHRDHERLEHQVGTLILQLPSVFEGGDLRVWAPYSTHKNDDPIDTAILPTSSSSLKYAAFYTDCSHEVTNLIDGNRCVLVFSLLSIPVPDNAPKEASPLSLSIASSGSLLGTYLKHFQQDHSKHNIDKLVIPLSHSYTRRSLTSKDLQVSLKGSDVDLVKIVSAAIKEAGFEAFICLFNLDGPAVNNMESKGNVLADTDYPPIRLPGESVISWNMYTNRIPIFEDEILQEGKNNILPNLMSGDDTNSNSGKSAAVSEVLGRRFQKAAIILWPSSKRDNLNSCIIGYKNLTVREPVIKIAGYSQVSD